MKLTDLHIEGLIEYLKSDNDQFKKEYSNLLPADKDIISRRLLDNFHNENENTSINIITTFFEIQKINNER